MADKTTMVVTHNNYTEKPKRIVLNSLQVNESTEGETLEQQIERMVNNKEPIKEGTALIYTERKDGIKPEMNIRTDRWEIAIEATEKIARSYKAKREERHKPKDGEPEPIQGTGEDPKKSA